MLSRPPPPLPLCLLPNPKPKTQNQSRGADPDIPSDDFDPYLDPGPKLPRDLAADDATRAKIVALERRYAPSAAAAGEEGGAGGGGGEGGGGVGKGGQPRAARPHPQLGCFWALYDHGPDAVASWPADRVVEHPEAAKRARDRAERRAARERRRALRDCGGGGGAGAGLAALSLSPAAAAAHPSPSPSSPPCVYLFPGQGSQELGKMLSCSAAARLPAVAAMLSSAREILGYDLLALVEGPPPPPEEGEKKGGDEDKAAMVAAAKERLDDTAFAQPALFVAGLAALEALKARQQQEQQGQQAQGQQQHQQQDSPSPPPPPPPPIAVAGLSLGEYCALVAAGALSFEDGLRVVQARGQAMAAAAGDSGGRPHGMLSVVGLPDARLEGLVAEARAEAGAAWAGGGGGGSGGGGGGGGGQRGGGEAGAAAANGGGGQAATVLEVANLLFPEGRVVSGHRDALHLLKAKAEAAGALKATLLRWRVPSTRA